MNQFKVTTRTTTTTSPRRPTTNQPFPNQNGTLRSKKPTSWRRRTLIRTRWTATTMKK